uniref:Uncharacterized protein n=1 Tax=Podoviridae sp. ctZkC8 TaxID=2825259 RepID=A0A8S5UC38_9CAUD|nr:MAG TPA: hypothetical protein [Podoviridae sp. ctZkC8]
MIPYEQKCIQMGQYKYHHQIRLYNYPNYY